MLLWHLCTARLLSIMYKYRRNKSHPGRWIVSTRLNFCAYGQQCHTFDSRMYSSQCSHLGEIFASRIADIYQIPLDKVRVEVTFLDKETEPVAVNNQNDLDNFYAESYIASKMNKFVAQDSSVPDSEYASSVQLDLCYYQDSMVLNMSMSSNW